MSARPLVWHEEHGSGAPTLLLVHGLGATGEVWRGVCELAAAWPGARLLVDLPGHGRSGRLPGYSYDAHALQLQALLGARPGAVVVAGHSMGGYVGILLAGQPPRWFDTREEAAARYLRSVGLDGVVAQADPLVSSGIAAAEGRWRLAFDPAANQVGPPDMERCLGAARAKVTLARGSGDGMVSAADLAALPAGALELPGLGHNAHVEDPAALWRLIASASRDAGVL